MGAGQAAAADNWVGSWKLNASKSQLGSNAIRAQTLKFEVTPDGIKLTSDGTDGEGKPMHGGYTSKFDGKDVPWSGNPMADVAAPKRVVATAEAGGDPHRGHRQQAEQMVAPAAPCRIPGHG